MSSKGMVTVRLEQGLRARAQREAGLRGMSFAAFVRESLEAALIRSRAMRAAIDEDSGAMDQALAESAMETKT